MVFIGGARQVGKTSLSLSLLANGSEFHPTYFNWDNPKGRKSLLHGELPPRQPLIILDEIHKFGRWRNLVKGLYDTNNSQISFLITGSARLDYYRRGGDSLQGRYRYYRLHPFSLAEFSDNYAAKDLYLLLRFDGSPSVYFAKSYRWFESIVVISPKLVVTSTRLPFRFPIKELGNDRKGLVVQKFIEHPGKRRLRHRTFNTEHRISETTDGNQGNRRQTPINPN
jgi:hypothetical protein